MWHWQAEPLCAVMSFSIDSMWQNGRLLRWIKMGTFDHFIYCPPFFFFFHRISLRLRWQQWPKKSTPSSKRFLSRKERSGDTAGQSASHPAPVVLGRFAVWRAFVLFPLVMIPMKRFLFFFSFSLCHCHRRQRSIFTGLAVNWVEYPENKSSFCSLKFSNQDFPLLVSDVTFILFLFVTSPEAQIEFWNE